MNFGIKIDEKDNKAYCLNCRAHVGNDGKAQMKFCPRCSSPLTLEAAKQEGNKISKAQATILYDLLDRISDGANPTEEIKKMIEELS